VPPIEGDARVRDGVRLSYTLWQRALNAPRWVLIHSLALDRSFWLPVAERLARSGSVLTYDCRGHGRSIPVPGPYAVEQFARDLADLLDAVGWASAVVAGASMGGCVALCFADSFPPRTDALGLIDTTAWYGPQAPAQWEERARRALDHGLSALVDFQTTRWFGDAFRAEHLEVVSRCVAAFLANDLGCYAASCRMLGALDLREAALRVSCPTAVVVGEEDYATPPAMAEQLHTAIPASSLDIIRGGRHLTPLEVPERIADVLSQLAARGGRR